MIDIASENLLSVKEARLEFPNRPSVPTLWRWMMKGISGVVLESVRIGGRRFTSREACQRFLEGQSSAAGRHAKSKKERHRALDSIQAMLDQLGVTAPQTPSP